MGINSKIYELNPPRHKTKKYHLNLIKKNSSRRVNHQNVVSQVSAYWALDQMMQQS